MPSSPSQKPGAAAERTKVAAHLPSPEPRLGRKGKAVLGEDTEMAADFDRPGKESVKLLHAARSWARSALGSIRSAWHGLTRRGVEIGEGLMPRVSVGLHWFGFGGTDGNVSQVQARRGLVLVACIFLGVGLVLGSMGTTGGDVPGVSPAGSPDSYTVQRGDTLGRIAASQLGDRKRWREIVALNEGTLTDPDSLDVATILHLPPR